MTMTRLLSSALFTATASLLFGCASAAPSTEGAAPEADAAHVENGLSRACAGQCMMDYTACFQFSDGDSCGCYPSYVSCMKNKCLARPAFPPPTCADAGPVDTGAPDADDAADPCPVECHCGPNSPHVAPACTSTCTECRNACGNDPTYHPCR